MRVEFVEATRLVRVLVEPYDIEIGGQHISDMARDEIIKLCKARGFFEPHFMLIIGPAGDHWDMGIYRTIDYGGGRHGHRPICAVDLETQEVMHHA